MKYLVMLLSVLTSINVYADELKVLKVLDQEKQLVLIETLGIYDDITFTVDGQNCKASVQEKVGNHAVVKVHKKTTNEGTTQKTSCELTSLINVDSIDLTPPKGYQYSQVRVSLGAGLSFGEKPPVDSNANFDTIQFNYALAIYKQSDDFMIGGIYQVYSFRAYGSIKDPTKPNSSKEFEYQANNHLLGLSMRKLYGDLTKTATYLRGDLGFAWATVGEGIIASPGGESYGSGVGANLGAGLLINTGRGAVDLGIYQSFVTNSESDKIGTNTNLSIGYMF